MPSRPTIVLIFAILACLFLWVGAFSFSEHESHPVHNVDELESVDDFTRSLDEIFIGLDEITSDD